MSDGAEHASRGLLEVFKVVRQAAAFGTATSENGAQMYGQVPHVAPEAWLHIVYPGLDDAALASLESNLQRPIPGEYRSLLKVTNGLTLFSGALDLYGRRTDYSRRVAIRLPFDLSNPNVHERPRAADPSWFIFGFYDEDGSKAYVNPVDGRVYRGSRDMTKPRLNEWAGLDDFLSSEVQRLRAHFDDSGHQLDPSRPTTPSIGSN
ncbi:MAG TPA: SMI1/KNR4 family protein [Candidatus Dormibacteraeota bacterium]|jgi:hypothetical protein|nr:SMI1/KNR4 family protein [Candidatus Dormibacteraeota bacterium]